MGYYSGSGVETGGGEEISCKEQIIWYGVHNVYQKIRSSTNVKNGVSLATAQAATSSMSLSDQTWTSGMVSFWSRNCKGSSTKVSYSQIGGSNLYSLQTVSQNIQVRDGLNWSPSGWQA